jgi:hypothetical protein
MPAFPNKIFEIGHGRTGTNSLTVALRMLGYDATHGVHGKRDQADCLGCLTNGTADYIIATRHQAILNWPAVAYRELDAKYPGSKFILPYRKSREWATSIAKHAAAARGRRRALAGGRLSWGIAQRLALYGCVEFQRERFIRRFCQHNAQVVSYFAGRHTDLLVIDICAGHGWDRLCPFLGDPAPDTPFPVARNWAEAKEQTRGLIA